MPVTLQPNVDAKISAGPARDVEHAALAVKPHVIAEQPDLLGARGVLELVIALDDLQGPVHGGAA
jgi:hypothetical protein